MSVGAATTRIGGLRADSAAICRHRWWIAANPANVITGCLAAFATTAAWRPSVRRRIEDMGFASPAKTDAGE
jgi:hypothetical protein